MSFVGDCPDEAMLEDVLSALQEALHPGSPTHQPLISCLELHGGERLFMSLLQREQQSLRLLGLQILTAFQNRPLPSRPSRHGEECPPCKFSAETIFSTNHLLFFSLSRVFNAALSQTQALQLSPLFVLLFQEICYSIKTRLKSL